MTNWNLDFQSPGHPVAWVLFGLVLCGLVAWAYAAMVLPVPRPVRVVLAALRTLAILLIFASLLRPSLTFEEVLKERRPLVLLVDISRSMGIQDEKPGQISRLSAVREAMAACSDVFDRLQRSYRFDLYVFGSTAKRRDEPLPLPPAIEPTTAIGDALETARQRVQGFTGGTVILITDGVCNAGKEPRQAVAGWNPDVAELHCIGVGQDVPSDRVRDQKVTNLNCPTRVNIQTLVPVVADAAFIGMKDRDAVITLSVDGQTVATKHFRPRRDMESTRLLFEFAAETEGTKTVEVEIKKVEGEVDNQNNKAHTFVRVGRETLGICWLEACPRWEARFMRSAATDLGGLYLDVVYLDPNQPGTDKVRPAGVPDMKNYRVIVIGDIPAAQMGDLLLKEIEEGVTLRGTGLMMVGGLRNLGPGGWGTSRISRLVPFRMTSADPQVNEPFKMTPEANGLADNLLRMDEDPIQSGRIWKSLPLLDGYVQSPGIKPSATVLARDGTPAKNAIMAAHEQGKGRILGFLADTTWKWALCPDPDTRGVHRRFWRQILLWLAHQEGLDRKRLWLSMDRYVFFPSEAVPLTVFVQNEKREPIPNAAVVVTVTDPDGNKTKADLSYFSDSFHATLNPKRAGAWSVDVVGRDGVEEIGTDSAKFFVSMPDPEMDDPVANFAALQEVASASGGKVEKLSELPVILRRLAENPAQGELHRTRRQAIWNRHEWAGAFLLLLTIEWILRRKYQVL